MEMVWGPALSRRPDVKPYKAVRVGGLEDESGLKGILRSTTMKDAQLRCVGRDGGAGRSVVGRGSRIKAVGIPTLRASSSPG
jgi:hypothetical protein